jgi:hypothetical protein
MLVVRRKQLLLSWIRIFAILRKFSNEGREPAELGAQITGWHRSSPIATSKSRCWGHS